MSVQSTDGYTLTELRAMDEATAKTQLSYAEYQKWESVQTQFDAHEQRKQEFRENEREATDILVRSDVSNLAADVELFGNPASVYYAPDDPRIREPAERLGDLLGVDPDADPDDVDIAAEDVAEEVVPEAKDVLAELVVAALVAWDGTDELSTAAREQIRTQIVADPPEGWGIAGLMDAWVEIQVAVEERRDERLDRIRKFRDETRRGDR